ncbi:hypothetical protein, partial [Kitasatospora sp. NPDC004289]
ATMSLCRSPRVAACISAVRCRPSGPNTSRFADRYLLVRVLPNWGDEEALRILRHFAPVFRHRP